MYNVGDKVKDLAGNQWTITRVGFDPGERQTYYNVRRDNERGFVWAQTLAQNPLNQGVSLQ